MRGSRLVLALIVLLAAVALWYTGRPSRTTVGTSGTAPVGSKANIKTSQPPAGTVSEAPSVQEAVPATVSNVAPDAPAAPPPKTRSGVLLTAPPPEDVEALERDLTHVQLMFREYRDMLGENPVGNNAEIMRAILGDNLKQAKIGAPENQTMNAEGELCDRWGTPYFFHQVSRDRMEVRSAGPDRKMWTADDRQMN